MLELKIKPCTLRNRMEKPMTPVGSGCQETVFLSSVKEKARDHIGENKAELFQKRTQLE